MSLPNEVTGSRQMRPTEPAIQVILNKFSTINPIKAPIAQFCAFPGNAPDCAIGAVIGLHGQKRI
jgi:hypothetical protein